ncbi:MAG: hypothetical protein Q9226_007110 [Calogaya cf. arnoldii]
MWKAIENNLKELKTMEDSMGANSPLSKRLPPDYERALFSFISLTSWAWKYALGCMLRLLLADADLIEFTEMVPASDHVAIRLRETSNAPPILDLLSKLTVIEKRTMMGPLNILDEFEHIMESDTDPLHAIEDLQDHLTGTSLGPYTKPVSAFVYPVGKKPTLEHVEQMRRAEAKLDFFWDQVDNCKLRPRTGKTLLEWMGDRITVRNVSHTAPWQPAVQKSIGSALLHTAFQPLPNSTPLDTYKPPTEPRKKQKTRGEGFSTTEHIEATTGPIETKPNLQTLILPHKAYKTMTAFFPSSVQDRISRKVLWEDFLRLMYTLGFQIQKRHGSEWYFEPSWRRNAPITIHQPHHSPEMRFDKIRFEANRMARKYGWSTETFVCAD